MNFFNNTVLTKENYIFLDTKKNPNIGIKSFFPIKFHKFISGEQTNVLLNTIQLYNGRNKIIKLFEDKNITYSAYALNAKSEPEEYDGVKE